LEGLENEELPHRSLGEYLGGCGDSQPPIPTLTNGNHLNEVRPILTD
jgi:hypothetical protein